VTTRPDLFDRLLHHRPRALHVREAGREDAAERTLLRRPREQVLRGPGMAVFDEHVIHHSGGCDKALA
jgi:hypothetical protein